MRTHRRTRLLLLLPALVLALLWPAPAVAADEIGLSRDGVTWAPELTVPLFEPERRWVPGDDETRTFQVRNQGPSAATMTIEALSPGGDELLSDDVALSVRVDGGDWTALELEQVTQELTVRPLEVDRAVAADVRAVFDPASTNPTQDRELHLSLRIILTGDVSPGGGGEVDGAGTGAGADRGGLLPSAGATVGPEVLVAAMILCALGAVLIARRSSSDDPSNGAIP